MPSAPRFLLGLALAAQLAAPVQAAKPAADSPRTPVTTPAYETPYGPDGAMETGLWMDMDETERRLKLSPQVIRDPDLNAYVRGVLCRTVGEKSCAAIRIYLMKTPDYNASMAPNGMMLINSGLLLRTLNEAQLAAVLGHEFTHYEHRHSLLSMQARKKKGAQAAWLAISVVGLFAAMDVAAGLSAYSRDMEREADLGGLDRLAKAGYDTREAAAPWALLRAEMDATAAARGTKSRKDKDLGRFESHPPTSERLAYLTEEGTRLLPAAAETGADRYARAMARWWPEFVDDQLKGNDFGASDFLLSQLASGGWTPWLLLARGELYRRRAGAGDLDKAAGWYGDGIAAGGDLPELWRGRGLALLKLGRSDEGKRDLHEYLARAPQAPDRAMMEILAGEKP